MHCDSSDRRGQFKIKSSKLIPSFLMKTPTAKYLKYLNYLVFLGPMLIIAGLTAGVVAGGWTAIPVGLILVGIAIVGVWLIAQSQHQVAATGQPGFWQRRSTESSANALVTTLAVLAILGLVNFLGAKHVWRMDLTDNQQFTLAPQTQELVKTLQQPVKVWLFDKQQASQDRELLESYRRLNEKFSFEYVDPQASPTLAQQLDVKKIGDVVLELQPNQRKQFVQSVNAQERLSESRLTNAIAGINSDRRSTVYFLQGHGERPIEPGKGAITQAVKLLGEQNFVNKPLNLAQTKEFPADAKVVVVAGPQKPLLEAEVKALQTYVDKGGNLMLMVDPTNPEPKLGSLLNPWGVTLDQRVAIDASGSGKLINLGPADALVTQYGDHPITKELQGKLSFFSLARPVQVKAAANVKATPLLFTSDRSWAESDLKSQPLQFNPGKDLQGPLVLGFALTRPVSASQSESRLVVIGNSTFATDGLFDQVVNGDVFLNSVRWLSQQEQATLSLRPKESNNRRITMTEQLASLTAWLSLVILPLFGFAMAIFFWWRRR